MPLILTHGWPWTFWDFEQVIGPLTDPAAYGGDPADAFDVVVPSLPGFGFSTPLRVDGLQTSKAVDLWARLMTDVLGYERFATGGGDFGAMLSGTLGYRYPERVLGVYLTLPSLPSTSVPENLPEPGSTSQLVGMLMGPAMRTSRDDFAPDERHRYDTMEERWKTALSHIAVHTTDPQTLAFALHDSPAGLASWLVERRRNWSDNDGDVEQAFSRQFLLDTVRHLLVHGELRHDLTLVLAHFPHASPASARPRGRPQGAPRPARLPQGDDLRAPAPLPRPAPTSSIGASSPAAATSPPPRSPTSSSMTSAPSSASSASRWESGQFEVGKVGRVEPAITGEEPVCVHERMRPDKEVRHEVLSGPQGLSARLAGDRLWRAAPRAHK